MFHKATSLKHLLLLDELPATPAHAIARDGTDTSALLIMDVDEEPPQVIDAV